jgi:hypothetical protein
MSSDPTPNQHSTEPEAPPESRLERWATAPYAADPLGVPAAERRRRRRELWLSSLVLVAIAVIAIGQQWATAPRGALPVGELVTHRYPLAQIHDGIERALHPDEVSLKIVVLPQQ